MNAVTNVGNTEAASPPPTDSCVARLHLTLSRVEGVLVRVLGVVVRRGFEPIEVRARVIPGAATAADPSDVLVLELRLQSPHPAAGLAAHLAKLIDVQRVEVLP